MIHSRLRRSLRLAVDYLSSHLAVPSSGFRLLHLQLRGTPPGAVPIFQHPWLQHPVLRLARRYLASNALLIALALDICACNPAEGKPGTLAGATNTTAITSPESTFTLYDPPEPATEASSLPSFVNDRPFNSSASPVETRPLPWAISESVYFIYRSNTNQDANAARPRQAPVATAFVVSVPDRAHREFDRFLVTARHIVDPQWAGCYEQNPASIELRLNRRNGGVGYETIPLFSGSVRRFYTSPDPTADLAIIPLDQRLIPNLDDYKLVDVPFRLLPSDSEIRLIRADQQVMTAKPSGGMGSYPVFESGYLSKMPNESVDVQCRPAQSLQSPPKRLHVWFINAGVPQGVSGAPVYASVTRGPGSLKSPILLGIQSVAWPDKGIAGITPSPALCDLIQSVLRGSRLNPDFYRGPNP